MKEHRSQSCCEPKAFLMSYGPTIRLRTLDALHLAIAFDLKERGLAQNLITADAAMASVGSREGLVIVNPLSPTR